jgi:xanthine dehydrogenase accessory factor
LNIFADILALLEAEKKAVLATVIATSGSTPTASLSKMLIIHADTKNIGTVGGGSMEYEVAQEAKRLIPTGKAKILTFHLQDDQLLQGLICGGTLEVLLEPINKNQIPLYQHMRTMQENGKECFLWTFIQTDGTVKEKKAFPSIDEALTWTKNISEKSDASLFTSGADTYRDHPAMQMPMEIQRIRTLSGEIIIEPMLCPPDLFIFGGGHIGSALCNVASDCNFRVVVIDDREEYARAIRFPKAAQLLTMNFLCAFDHITITPTSYIVIVTRGHQFDEEVLERALQSNAGYIGMIGSRRKIEAIYRRLQEKGVSRERLEQVYAPIGIELGAVTPAEISISILAQLIRIRRRAHDGPRDKSELMYSFSHKNNVQS